MSPFLLTKAVQAVAILAAGALFGTAYAQSPSRASQSSVLLSLLRAPHPEVSGPQLRRLGSDVAALLIEFASAEARVTSEPQVRLRAMAWLQYFPSRASKAVLLEVFHAAQGDIAGRRVAVRALAVAFGVEALPTLRLALQSPNLYLREAAAYALGDVDDRRVRSILVDHLARETELAVRDAATVALQRGDERDRDRR